MKILDKEKITKENLEEDVLSEVRSMKIVNHPYIVRLIEVLKTNRKILLLMDYMDGGDLFDAIKSEKSNFMNEDKARRYFQQIISAVNYLHNKNIIHRDLKPENILIDKKNHCIKITDFGLSALIKQKNQILPDIAGTTDYLAPEVIKQIGYLGQSADIWSCGVILFNCVTGKKPFIGTSSVMLNNILCGNVEYPSHKLSKNLIDLLKNILDPNPSTRYNIQQIESHSWFIKDYDKVKKFVDDYLQKNQENVNIYPKKSLELIETMNFNQKDIMLEENDIPLISAFELGMILYGKSVRSLFQNEKGDFNDLKDFKFIYKKNLNCFGKMVKQFFTNNDIESEFSKIEKDKVIISLVYKATPLILLLNVFKLTKEGKMLFVFSFKSGLFQDFQHIMEIFFSKLKGEVEKI
jgi:5'-AMP-activated protein kinase catalytic alpha subunit